MNGKTELEKVSEETIRFMRGKYAADEIGINKATDGGSADGLKFRRSGKTILTIYIYDDRYDFLVIFGKAEREKFEARRDEFPQKIQDIYDNSKTYHDGKWMMIPVADLDTLKAVKQMIMIKKKPNRKPFPKEQAVYGDCGHRCDLCVHYTGSTVSDELRAKIAEHIRRVYTPDQPRDETKKAEGNCNGCGKKGFGESCPQKECAAEKNVGRCLDCPEYDCGKATAGIRGKIEPKSISADDVTWAILPYVPGQYGN